MGEREEGKRAEHSTGKEEAADFRGDTWENAHCVLTGGEYHHDLGFTVNDSFYN